MSRSLTKRGAWWAPRWRVAVGCSIGLAVGFGPIFIYNFGLFQKPIIAELGWTRGDISLGFSIATLVASFLNYFVGNLIDHVGVRPIAIAGAIILPMVLIGFSLAHSYGVFLLISAAMGFAGASSSYPTYMSALPQWFDKRLGLAFSVAAAGVGYGTALAAPFINRLIMASGWQRALRELAMVVLLIGLGNALLLVKDRRGARGVVRATNQAAGRRVFRAAIRSGLYWRLTLAFALVPIVSIGINFHLAAMLSDRGFGSQYAAAVIGVGGIAILIARVCTGAVLDYASPAIVGSVLFVGQAAGALLLAFGVGGLAPFVAAFLIGLASGGEGDLMPYVLSRRYGPTGYGRIYGTSFAMFNLGTLTGPLLMGMVFVKVGSYQPALIALAGLALVAAILVLISAGPRASDDWNKAAASLPYD